MKQRLIVAAVGVPLTAAAVWFLSGLPFTLIMLAVAASCIFELFKNVAEPAGGVTEPMLPLGGKLLRLIPTAVLIAGSFWLLGMFRSLEKGRELTLVLFACTYGSDAGAMLVGKYLGKRHPFPKISPNKTEMGVIGGLLVPVVIAMICALILSLAGMKGLLEELTLMGLVIGAASEAGDLFFSSIKRKLGIKDYGSILPGHGGLLDRFDSMVFAIPAAWAFLLLAYHLS